MAPAALPRALVLSLLLVAASTTAWAQEEASSPISMPPASGPTGASPLLDQQLDSVAVAPASVSSSQPPASSASSPSAADAPSDGVSAATHASPPVPSESPAHAPSRDSSSDHLYSATPAPAPAAAADKKEADKAPAPAPGAAHKEEADKDKDKEEEEGYYHKKKKKAPAPAPAAAQVKAVSGEQAATGDAQAEEGSHEEMNGGKKAGVVVGAFTAAAVVGLGAFVWKKRRANIRRARYAEYSARLEMA